MDFRRMTTTATSFRPARRPTGCSAAECSRLICTVPEEVACICHAGKYVTDIDSVCTRCTLALYETGDLTMIRSGHQYIDRL